MTTRRQFLWGTGGLFALGALAKPVTGRAANKAQNLILVVADGGWDVSYCMDPKLGLDTVDGPDSDPMTGNVDDKESLLDFGRGHIALNPYKRRSVGEFFQRWGDQTAVINGIDVGSVAHQACKIRIMTGTQTETNPDMAIITGHHFGDRVPIGCMDLSGLGFAGPFAASAGRTGQSNQLKLLLDRSKQQYDGDPLLGVSYPQFLSNQAERAAIEAFRARRDARFIEARLQADAIQHTQYLEAQDRREQLLANADLFSDNLSFKSQAVLGQQIGLITDLLSTQLAASIVVDSGPSWDTHDDNIGQHVRYRNLFSDLDDLLVALHRESLLENTVVAVVSEMSRTPKRNSELGKDHWPSTSALVIGTNIAGGTSYGGTDRRLDPENVDYATGEVTAEGNPLRYDNFCAGLLQAVGVESDSPLYLPGINPFSPYLK